MLSHGVGPEAWQPYWLPDNRSFVYGRMQSLPPGAPATEARQKFRSYLHVLGTDPEKDTPVFGYGVVPSIDVDPSLIASVETQPGSRYAIGVLNGSVTPNSAYYIAPVDSIGKPNPAWRKVADFADGVTRVIVHGDDLYLLTYKDAPRSKIVRIDARKPDLASAETIVPSGEAVIAYATAAQDALYVQLSDGGIGRMLRVLYGPAPKAERIALPFDGSVYVRSDPRLPGAMLYMTSWAKFGIYLYNAKTRQVTDTEIQPVGPYGNPANVESVEVKARSYDGTSVPLSIVYPKGMRMDGSNPTYLTGYGAYGTSQSPGFRPTSLAWNEKGGVIATCHVRGGGEYGEEWHLAGKGKTKPNTWRDFIACAQYLIDNKYTSPARLAGEGASAGGILIGRAITERPDLFGVALIDVGLLDTLRFETTGNGETNIPEFGSTKTAEGFAALYEMSALHHVKDGTAYPAVMLTTGMNDPRVDSWMPAKMTARLQAATSSGKPVLLRVNYGGRSLWRHRRIGNAREPGGYVQLFAVAVRRVRVSAAKEVRYQAFIPSAVFTGGSMKLRYLFAVLLIAASIVWSQSAAPPSQPKAAVRPVTDDYFGTKVVDPYRYMENLKDPEVQAWFAGQNDYTRAVLASIPGRAQLLARIQELSQSVPFVIATRLPGDLYLIEKKLPTEDVPKMYLRSGLNGKDRLLADPERITLTGAKPEQGQERPFRDSKCPTTPAMGPWA